MKTLIDTDILIEFLRGNESVADPLLDLIRSGSALISGITVAEIYAGMRDKESIPTVNLLESCELVSGDFSCYRIAGEMVRKYKSSGVTLHLADCINAGIAKSYGLLIATKNKKHYPESTFDTNF